jgi:HNH endonuclease
MPDPRQCIICNNTFTPDRSNKAARFCSKRCVWKGTRGPSYNAEVARASAAKRGDMLRDRGDGEGYRKVGGRHEHRVIAEQMLGRPLTKGEVVHHRDGNKRNNAPENLEVMTQAEHMREHGLGVPGMELFWKPWKGRKRNVVQN